MRFTCEYCFEAQYDWTTGVPDNGNEWRKFGVVPRLRACIPLFCRGWKQKGFKTTRGGRGSFPLYGGTFVRSYSVLIVGTYFSRPQKGPAERGYVKNRQKVSKIFSTLFDKFRIGQKSQKLVKKCQKFRNEKAAQRVSFGAGYPADVHANIPADVRGQKLRSGP